MSIASRGSAVAAVAKITQARDERALREYLVTPTRLAYQGQASPPALAVWDQAMSEFCIQASRGGNLAEVEVTENSETALKEAQRLLISEGFKCHMYPNPADAPLCGMPVKITLTWGHTPT
jgi:hypothetical protein